MNLSLVTPPAAMVLSLAEVKLARRIDHDTEDTLLTALIGAATDYAETYQHRQLLTATWKLKLDKWSSEIELPLPPLQSVTSITYVDPDGNTQTVPESVYAVDSTATPGRVVLKYGQSWPSIRCQLMPSIEITFVAGYGAPSAVPLATKQAMHLLVGHYYEHREAVGPSMVELPMAVHALLSLNCWGDYR